jgi:uncharacterized protein involved in cysteine biosynthesis
LHILLTEIGNILAGPWSSYLSEIFKGFSTDFT